MTFIIELIESLLCHTLFKKCPIHHIRYSVSDRTEGTDRSISCYICESEPKTIDQWLREQK